MHAPLLCGTAPPHFETWLGTADHLLEELARAPQRLPESLWHERRTPIGRYFESLIAFWLQQQPAVHDLRQNIPIFSGKRTLGELDLLFEAEGTTYHWELAVKLYLGTDSCLHAKDWLGPLARDRLDRKLDRLITHQLQLPLRPEAQQALRALGIEDVHSYGLVKGYLFHPYARWKSGQMQHPDAVANTHARGWWLRQASADELVAMGRELRYQALAKPDWLGPASATNTIEHTHIVDWLHAYFEQDERAILLAAVDAQGNERHRGFVVSDDWGASAIGA